jgi:hypothetical protein
VDVPSLPSLHAGSLAVQFRAPWCQKPRTASLGKSLVELQHHHAVAAKRGNHVIHAKKVSRFSSLISSNSRKREREQRYDVRHMRRVSYSGI